MPISPNSPSNDPNDLNENTNIIVNRMQQQRRSMRLPIIAGAIGLFGLMIIMYFGVGSRRGEDLRDVPPGDGAHGLNGLQFSAQGNSEQGPMGTVEVFIKHGGQLWVDQQNRGSVPGQKLKLAIGKHKIEVKRKDSSLFKDIDVQPNQAIQVTFERNTVIIDPASAEISKP